MASYQSVFKSLSDAKEQARAPGGLGDLDSVEWVDINISSTLISGETRFSEIFINTHKYGGGICQDGQDRSHLGTHDEALVERSFT